MNKKIIREDIKRNKAINIGLLIFIVVSSMLTILSSMIAVQTFTSITELYEVAKPPHFLQMHKGDYNQNEIDNFMQANEFVEHYQTIKMIDILGDNIQINSSNTIIDLSDFRLDIGLVKQNGEYDLLLDSSHRKIEIEDGYIGIPVLMKERYNLKIGDEVTISDDEYTKTFIISDFVIDSQMNSPLTSSTRILLSDNDHLEMEGKIGEFEYIIEAYFQDKGYANDFKTLYENANLPQNGQAVTYTMILVLSAMTDLITVFVLLVTSVLLIIISFVCLKFIILASLEEEVEEIGTMKAIGINNKSISSLYMLKYRFITVIGVILGYGMSLLLLNLATNHITTTFGDIPLSTTSIIVSLIAGIIMILITSRYCKKVLKRIRKVSIVDILVRGNGFSEKERVPKNNINNNKRFSINLISSFREVFYHFRSWFVVFMIIVISSLIMMIPANILSTFESPDFITYMGSQKQDILIEVSPSENTVDNYNSVVQTLIDSEYTKEYSVSKNIRFKTLTSEDIIYNIDVDCGVESGIGLQYLLGEAPVEDNEIALSVLNSDELGLNIGDVIELSLLNETYTFLITGIYQDVTSGGFTAKTPNEFEGFDGQKYSISIDLEDNYDSIAISQELRDSVNSGVKVYHMEEFINQTLGGVSSQLKTVVLGVVILGAALSMIITLLFLRLRLVKDQSEISILSAVGFSKNDLKKQYIIKVSIVALLGIIVGLLLTFTIGNGIVNSGLNLMNIGIKKVTLIQNYFITFFVAPVLLYVVSIIVTISSLKKIDSFHIMSCIKE